MPAPNAMPRLPARWRSGAALAAALLVLAPLLAHAPELAGLISCNPLPWVARLTPALAAAPHFALSGCVVDGNDGFTLQALGHLSAQDWLAGRLPWWNPYGGTGLPLAAEMQPAAFYMPFILLLHFAGGILYIKIATQVLAGLCTFACLRQLRASIPAALLGAAMFEFNGTFAWFGDTTILPVPYLPLLIAGIDRARQAASTGAAGGMPTIALAIALSLLAGFPETAALNGVLAFLWFGLVIFEVPRAARLAFVGKVISGGLIGLALAAPALISFIDYLAHGYVPFHYPASGPLVELKMAQGQEAGLLLPTLFGPPYHDGATLGWALVGGFIGAAPVFMGLLALSARQPLRPVHWLLLGWTLFWGAVLLGDPVTMAIWHSIPVLREGTVNRYIMPSFSFAWALLAACGWDIWRQGAARPGAAGGIFLLLAAAAVIDAALHARLSLAFGVPTLLWVLCLGAGLTWLATRKFSAAHALVAAALIAADVAFSFLLPITAARKPAALDLGVVNYLRAQPGFMRSYALGDLLRPNAGAYFATPTLQSLSIPRPLAWNDYAATLDYRVVSEFPFAAADLAYQASVLHAHRAAFAAAGVAYIVVPRQGDPIPSLHDTAFQPVFEDDVARIYRMADAAPYFSVIGGPCVLTVQTREKIDAVCNRPALLVRRELIYPGWEVTRDGQPAALQAAQDIFQSTGLPAGNSQLRWRYRPPHGWLMVLLLGLGMVAFVAKARKAVLF